MEIKDTITKHNIFDKWVSIDVVEVELSEMKLLLLGDLHYIGKAWIFNDIKETTAISRDTNRLFFLTFIKHGSTILYKR